MTAGTKFCPLYRHAWMHEHTHKSTNKKIKYSMKRTVFISQIMCYLPGFSSWMVSRSILRNQSVRKYICFLRLFFSSSLVVDHSYSVESTIELIHLPPCLWVCLLSTMSTLKLKGLCEHKSEIQSCYSYLGLRGSAVCSFIGCNITCKVVQKFQSRLNAKL